MIDWAGITFYDILGHFSLAGALGYGWGISELWFQRFVESSVH